MDYGDLDVQAQEGTKNNNGFTSYPQTSPAEVNPFDIFVSSKNKPSEEFIPYKTGTGVKHLKV
jgi:hypothetical protein